MLNFALKNEDFMTYKALNCGVSTFWFNVTKEKQFFGGQTQNTFLGIKVSGQIPLIHAFSTLHCIFEEFTLLNAIKVSSLKMHPNAENACLGPIHTQYFCT